MLRNISKRFLSNTILDSIKQSRELREGVANYQHTTDNLENLNVDDIVYLHVNRKLEGKDYVVKLPFQVKKITNERLNKSDFKSFTFAELDSETLKETSNKLKLDDPFSKSNIYMLPTKISSMMFICESENLDMFKKVK